MTVLRTFSLFAFALLVDPEQRAWAESKQPTPRAMVNRGRIPQLAREVDDPTANSHPAEVPGFIHAEEFPDHRADQHGPIAHRFCRWSRSRSFP